MPLCVGFFKFCYEFPFVHILSLFNAGELFCFVGFIKAMEADESLLKILRSKSSGTVAVFEKSVIF